MDPIKLGFNIYDIRDFFDNSYVKEYEESVISVRKYFSSKLNLCQKRLPYEDGCPSWNSDFIKYMDNLLDSDYSYLYEKTYYHKETDNIYIQMDYNFTKDCFEYFDKHNIDQNTINGEIPGVSTISNGFYHQCPFHEVEGFNRLKAAMKSGSTLVDYLLMTDDINFKLMKLCNGSEELPIDSKVGDWTESEENLINLTSAERKRKIWLNVLYAKQFHPYHQDGQGDRNRKFTCLNYPNVGRTLKDGGLFRYYDEIPVSGFTKWNVNIDKDSYHEILCNYTKVIILNHSIDNDIVGNLYHQVTKNLGEVRYNLYNTFTA